MRNNRATKLSARDGKPYTNIEVAYMFENYPLLGPVKCAEQLGRTRESVQTKAQKLGLLFIKDPEDDPWAVAAPTHKVTNQWTPDTPPGPRCVFDLANHLGMQQEKLPMA